MNPDRARPFLTVDVAVFRLDEVKTGIELLLVKRRGEPFAGCWALPGGFVEEGEDPCRAAARELAEETGLDRWTRWPSLLHAVGAFGAPGRDPRGWVVSVVFLVIEPPDAQVRAGDDAAEVAWFPLQALPELAFDHDNIIFEARKQLQVLHPEAAQMACPYGCDDLWLRQEDWRTSTPVCGCDEACDACHGKHRFIPGWQPPTIMIDGVEYVRKGRGR